MGSSMRWVFLVLTGVVVSSRWSSGSAVTIQCGECEESQCPELRYCEGEAVKDHCGCCTVCSSSKYQPHPLITNVENEASACKQVECPKFKVCVENVQGLPLCTCPSDYICRNRRKRLKTVCGTDGMTYESRCHLRIAACNSAMKIKVAKKGPCAGLDVSRPRTCESFSTCRNRKNQQSVCGTDGKSYMSRCHMKIVACQRDIKIKLKNVGVCPPVVNHAPSTDQWIGTSGVARDNGSAIRTRRRDGGAGMGRKWKKTSGNDVSGSDNSKAARRRRRREKRRRRKERRKKRRKARGKSKSRSRRFKPDKNLFENTFGDITWK